MYPWVELEREGRETRVADEGAAEYVGKGRTFEAFVRRFATRSEERPRAKSRSPEAAERRRSEEGEADPEVDDGGRGTERHPSAAGS